MQYHEVCFFARGGQGAVVAARLLVHAVSLEGLWGQAFPLFGGERRGAPVYSFARISDKPVRVRSQIREPDALIVFDRALLSALTFKVKKGGFVLANSPSKPSVESADRVYWVDATAIAKRNGLVVAGWPVVNTAMLGALTKVWSLVSLSSLKRSILDAWTGKLGEVNAKAAEEAYNEVMTGE
ncbi:MAG: 2-oxoacid:acceptor oxidoreductase family protein [Thermofilaceae archaeon]|nr:2-oxoacid:acceptor oxidoreductase family protein [Thermofilaceae archaeon]MCX8180073.1 2-oxoacid:acceptor oxidoreductase family protein [Thermofilaceae archaeon]MDW8004272.1 2-oxoacid:acceptor oxidoreductase family protein [Thermofilaceae archaeon]